MRRGEAEHRLYPELQSLLTLQIPDDWERVLVHDGHTVYGVRFYYRGGERDAVDISFWDNSQTYQTWVYGSTDKQYPTLQEAIERARSLMTMVAYDAHWSGIAFVRDTENRRLLDCVGIGKGTITRLTDVFGTLQKFRNASIDEIEATPGIGPDKAWLITGHLHLNVRYHELWDPSEERWVDLYRVPKEVIDQCVRTRTHLTQTIRNKYRLTHKEIEERGLVKERPREVRVDGL